MFDSLLNSAFLGSDPRRVNFRQAKQKLVEARGDMTLMADEVGQAAQPLNQGLGPWGTFGPQEGGFLLAEGQDIFPLKVGMNVVGRFPSSDVVVRDKHISRRHCVLLVHTNGTCELHDTASLNGTFVNGQRLNAPHRVASGDKVRLANRQLLFLSLKDYTRRQQTALGGDTETL